MPVSILYLLAGVAVGFLLYSAICYIFVKERWRTFLRVVIKGNIIYTLVSVGLVVYHFRQLTALGLSYFVVEVLVLAGVIVYERKVLRMGEQ